MGCGWSGQGSGGIGGGRLCGGGAELGCWRWVYFIVQDGDWTSIQLVNPSARYHGGLPLGLILGVCLVVLVGPVGLSDSPGGHHRI